MLLKRILGTRRVDGAKIEIQSIQVVNNVLTYETIVESGGAWRTSAHEYHLLPDEIQPPTRQPCCAPSTADGEDGNADKTKCGLKIELCEAPHQVVNHSTDHQLIKFILIRILDLSAIHDMEWI
jgi:hypothetical protein